MHGTAGCRLAEFLRGSDRRTYFKDPHSGPGLHDYRPAPLDQANLVSSLTTRGTHRPIIDLDVSHRLVPSSTVGHGHLYVEVEMSWWRYRLLLWAMRVAGIIGQGYYCAAVDRRQTLVRKPGVSKDATSSWGDSTGEYHSS